MNKVKSTFMFIKDNIITFIKWILCAIFIGLTVGTVATIFHFGLETVGGYIERFPWFIFLLPFAGMCIAGLYKIFNMEEDRGTNSILKIL